MPSEKPIEKDEDNRYVTLRFTPLSATFGAEVSGLDTTDKISERNQQTMRQALDKYQLLLMRQQQLDEAQQVRFAQLFGTCRVMWQGKHYSSQNELVHYLSNVDSDGNPIGCHPDPDSTVWHSDGSWSRQPPSATVLNAVQVPAGYGDTYFANMYQVYEGLNQVCKDRLLNLKAEHNVELTRAARYGRWPWQWWQAGPNRKPITAQLKWWARVMKRRLSEGVVCHPVVRNHPRTARPALFIGDHAWRIVGRPWHIGIQMMKEINAMKIDSAAIYVHKWQQNDLLIWDNGSLLHRVGGYDLEGQVRIMRRCVVIDSALEARGKPGR